MSVVIATRNRAAGLLDTLDRLAALPDRPEVVVVDNASADGTSARVAAQFPAVRLLTLPANQGALARNEGARITSHPYVAFSDDDSWWEPGALTAATRLLDAEPRMGLLAAHTVVAPEGSPDPLNAALAGSPLGGPPGLPGPPVLGFLGCAAVARRTAFLEVGGYHPLLFFGAEETLLAYDLAAAGWLSCYAPRITAVHRPATDDRPGRAVRVRRNELLTAWLRRPLPRALRDTWTLARLAPGDTAARHALAQATTRLPAALRHRHPLPPAVERDIRLVEAHAGLAAATTGRAVPEPLDATPAVGAGPTEPGHAEHTTPLRGPRPANTAGTDPAQPERTPATDPDGPTPAAPVPTAGTGPAQPRRWAETPASGGPVGGPRGTGPAEPRLGETTDPRGPRPASTPAPVTPAAGPAQPEPTTTTGPDGTTPAAPVPTAGTGPAGPGRWAESPASGGPRPGGPPARVTPGKGSAEPEREPGGGGRGVTVVVITHDRRRELLRTLDRLAALPERPPVLVTDNGSGDGTAAAVARRHPDVRVLRPGANLGAVGRNLAVRQVTTPYTAFCDDDTWWAPGSLARASALLDAHPEVAAVTARIVVEPGGAEDPIVDELRRSPLPRPAGLPGPALGSFLAGATVLRTGAFRAAGGFSPRLWLGGEEELLAMDLMAAGWWLVFDERLTLHHAPSTLRDASRRRADGIRNTLWTTWLRRRPAAAALRTASLLWRVPHDATSASAVLRAAAGLPWLLRERRALPREVERRLRLLDHDQRTSRARRYVG